MFRFPFTRCVIAFFAGWLGCHLAITQDIFNPHLLVLGVAASIALILSHKVFTYARVLLMFCVFTGVCVKRVQQRAAQDFPEHVWGEVIRWGSKSRKVGRVRLWGLSQSERYLLGEFTGIANSPPKTKFFSSRANYMATCDDPMPGGFSQSQYLRGQGLEGTVYLKRCEALSQEEIPNSRNVVIAKIFKKYLPQHWGLALALTTGDKSGMSSELKEECKILGISHVMAISGLHVGLVVLGLYWGLLPLARWPVVRVIATLAMGLFFVHFVGAPPSAQRALWALVFFWFSKLYFRKFYLEIALSTSLLFLVLFAPNLLFSMGLHLSIGAVLGIRGMLLVTAPWNQKIKNSVLKKILLSSWVTLGAQLGTLPLILYHFNAFPTYFLWNNLWAIPAFTILLYGLILGCGLSFLGILEEEWFGWVSRFISELENLITFHAQWPYAQLEHLYPSVSFCLLLALVIFSLLYLRSIRWVNCLAVFILIVLPWTYFPGDHPTETFCNRGREVTWTVENSILHVTAQPEDSAHFYQRLSDLSHGRIYSKVKLTLVNE